jgi:hypothetical protein
VDVPIGAGRPMNMPIGCDTERVIEASGRNDRLPAAARQVRHRAAACLAECGCEASRLGQVEARDGGLPAQPSKGRGPHDHLAGMRRPCRLSAPRAVAGGSDRTVPRPRTRPRRRGSSPRMPPSSPPRIYRSGPPAQGALSEAHCAAHDHSSAISGGFREVVPIIDGFFAFYLAGQHGCAPHQLWNAPAHLFPCRWSCPTCCPDCNGIFRAPVRQVAFDLDPYCCSRNLLDRYFAADVLLGLWVSRPPISSDHQVKS